MKLDWLEHYNLLICETVDSTNSEALRLVKAGVTGDLVIHAEKQTGGRGTKGRLWNSGVGNLYSSILYELPVEFNKCLQMPFLAANALYKTIVFFAKQPKVISKIKLKWPNDILIDGKKVAGILIESIIHNSKRYMVVGFGVNINTFPQDSSFKSTGMQAEGITVNNIDDFLYLLVSEMNKLYRQWLVKDNFAKIRQDWMKNAYNLNKIVTVDDGNKRISGIFKEIDQDGYIKLELAGGRVYSFNSVDVV